MKESHREGLANHSGPESCGCARESRPEALTGEHAGCVIEPRNQQSLDADPVNQVGKATRKDAPRQVPLRSDSVEERSMYGRSMCENREDSSVAPARKSGRGGKPIRSKPPMYDDESSDGCIVSTNVPNKASRCASEGQERRHPAKGNVDKTATCRTQSRTTASEGLERIRERARTHKDERFTALLHHVNVRLLEESFYELKRSANPGVDGVTWSDYQQRLEDNLKGLHERIHRGAYTAKPSKRGYIPKPNGEQRALGIASLEDKVVQRAVVKVLNAIYEEDFLGFSYGFRPHRSPHRALGALSVGIQRKNVHYILDADIRGYFDNMSHEWTVKFIEHRVGDKRVLRLIQQWLAAGVLEETTWKPLTKGTPQGATISPLLANVYLHYVFDLWTHHWRQKQAEGAVIAVRFADDWVVGFERLEDANRYKIALEERLKAFGLDLHPEKTRVIEFGKDARENRKRRGRGKPETFDFLGFTHICAWSQNGRFWIRRKTIKKRFRATLKQVKVGLRKRMHWPLNAQGKWLRAVSTGYFNYHAIPGNTDTLRQWRTQVGRHWLHTLQRRSQKDRTRWDWFSSVANTWLPPARAKLPWPEAWLNGNT